MIGKKVIKICLYLYVSLVTNVIPAQMVSPFNKLPVIDTGKNYSFIVSSHFHGSSANQSTFPASTILAGIDTLNALQPSFLMSLGDLFLDVNDTYIANYQKSLFSKMKMPLFNSVGNHDLSNGNMYEKIYGRTFFSFHHGQELFIILNTEEKDGDIKGKQLQLLQEEVAAATSQHQVQHIFIFSHRPVWAEEHPVYANIFRGNTRSQFGTPNYQKEIKPLIEHLAIPVYWMSGSMGGGPASFFYDKDGQSGITFMQTAIRDVSRDAVLLVSVKSGKVSFKGISLTGENIQPVETYNADYWTAHTIHEASFSFRLLPYLTLQLITHHFFWIGFVCGGLLILFLIALIKRWKRRK
jgi:hypothetical protein